MIYYLARQGFNIVMVSRNEAKMKEKVEELKREVKGKGGREIETRIVVADFAGLSTMQQYKEVIFEQVADLDIGVVVLNAGHAYNGCYHKISIEEVES